uniref:Uncharacterized protein n=1 Tax=Ditylenchus dipsaci TaxID=166011 RepID=A0A915DET2_9BILA
MHCQHFFVAASKNRALSSIIVARALSLVEDSMDRRSTRSGTNTFVNMLAESADVDGCHLRDAFYFHQSRATSAEEHFNSVCGLIANQMEQRERTGVIVIKDMSQPLEENLSQNGWHWSQTSLC